MESPSVITELPRSKRVLKVCIITIPIFIISCIILGVGISFCLKIDSCVRPIINGQCSDATESCVYDKYDNVVSGSCCSNTTTTQQCLCCKYYNSNTYRYICFYFIYIGSIGSLAGFIILISCGVYYVKKKLIFI